MENYLGWFTQCIESFKSCTFTLAGVTLSFWDIFVWSMFESIVCAFIGKYVFGD